MSWDSISNNQTVSFNNLQSAVNGGHFVAKTSIPATNEQITKADADAKVYLDTSYSPFANKASNQLVVKSNLRPISYAYTVYYNVNCYWDGFYTEGGAGNASAACGNSLSIVLYSPISSFQNGMVLFYDSACSNYWYGSTGLCGAYYKVIIAGTSYTFSYGDSSSNVQNLSANCSSPTYDFYIAEAYDCNGCVYSENVFVCFPAGQSVTIGRYYVAQGGPDGFAYKVISTNSQTVSYILSNTWGSFTSCFLACFA